MKILEIHIYGYGKLENVIIKDLSEFSVFYGKNEAGKSTIMSFIHSILFGFPTKQQSEQRYEPKKGSKYGGKLLVSFPEKGKVTIERVKGKAVGDVSVLFEDGTSGGEDLLKDLLSRIDKNLYTSIFSFNLQGLQNVHNLKSEDLGKFLFSTGTIGSESLFITEGHLQKELETRFKPNGKKPVINEKLKEVKEIHQRLKKARMQNDEYRNLLLQKENLLGEVAQGEKQQSLLRKQYHRLEEWKKLLPVTEEKKRTESFLNHINDNHFPMDGIARLEELNQLLKPIESQIAALKDKRNRMKRELVSLKPDKLILEREVEINQAVESFSLYETLMNEKEALHRKQKEAEFEIASLKEQLHLPASEQKIGQIDTSIFMKERTEEAARKQNRLQDRKEELDRIFQEEKESLEKVEEQHRQLKKRTLTPEERKEKEQTLLKVRKKDITKKELEGVKDKIYFLETSLAQNNEQARQRRIQGGGLGLLFAFLAFWGLWSGQWLIAVGAALGLFFSLFLFGKSKREQNSSDINKEIEVLKKREKELASQLENGSLQDIALLEDELKKDDEILHELRAVKIKLKQQEEQYEKVIRSYELWEKETKEHETLLRKVGRELFLPERMALEHIHDAFLLIEEIKKQMRELDRIREQAEEKLTAFISMQNKFTALKEYFFAEDYLPLQEAIFLLKKRLKEESSNRIKYEKEEERLRETEEEIKELTSEADHLSKEKMKLFQLAKVENEEDYRLSGKMEEKRNQLKRKLAELTGQIQLSPLNKEEIEQFTKIEDIDEEMESLQEKIVNLNEQMEKARSELSDIKHRIDMLEDGTEYAELLHRYYQLKSDLDNEAKEWAKYAIARNYLKKTVARFQNEHLPNMLRKAEKYLSYLTKGNYKRIIPKKDSSGFLIEHTDGLTFEANELSQSTTEQVYVSLRLALATTIYKKLPLPIIIDDSFVNFDGIRAENAIELMKSMKNNQIFFFTCHRHLLPYFKEQKIITMEEENSFLSKD